MEIREKKQCLKDRIQHLKKSSHKQKKVEEMDKELALLEETNKDKEMEIGDFKRFILREAFYLRFNALQEYAEKLAILAGFGKYVADLFDIEPTPQGQERRKPYTKATQSSMIIMDALLTVDGWRTMDERPTLGELMDEEDEEDASLLTDNDINTLHKPVCVNRTPSPTPADPIVDTTEDKPHDKPLNKKKSLLYSRMNYPNLYGSMSDIQKNPISRPYNEFQNQYQEVLSEKKEDPDLSELPPAYDNPNSMFPNSNEKSVHIEAE
ncbi:Eisosome component PIL1-domain-containing protein [Pilobolus umbonatus]|nr:Eisosome component PIL1-domain-containing protein [Pilobolus umbonatus]